MDMTIQEPEQKKTPNCPIPKTHRRLAQAHVLWHQAFRSYLNPEVFLANLNATIEALRNVTFVLRNEKGTFAKFDEWYGPWQARLKDDKMSRWLHEARSKGKFICSDCQEYFKRTCTLQDLWSRH